MNPVCWPHCHQEPHDCEQASRHWLLVRGALAWELTVASGRDHVAKYHRCLRHTAGTPIPLVALQVLILGLKV